MAYGTNQLKAFKYLQKIAEGRQRYAKNAHCLYKDIYTIYGSLYATNGIVLAQVDYPEFEHISDDGWKVVESFTDEKGYLRISPVLSVNRPRPMRDDIFSDMFIKRNHFESGFAIDPKVLKDGLYLFDIYKMNPSIAIDGHKLELSGHDREVSIRVLMMGVI